MKRRKKSCLVTNLVLGRSCLGACVRVLLVLPTRGGSRDFADRPDWSGHPLCKKLDTHKLEYQELASPVLKEN